KTWMPIYFIITTQVRSSKFYSCYITKIEYRAIFIGFDYHIFKFLGLAESTLVLDDSLKNFVRRFTKFTWSYLKVLIIHSFGYILRNNVVNSHFLWIQPYAHRIIARADT